MRLRWIGLVVILGLVATAAAWLHLPDRGWQTRPQASASPLPTPEQLQRGRYLVQAGDCIACHTAQGQVEFSGNREIPTPFGAIYSSNLTPDEETGLGRWTSDDFWGAMHFGRSRDGRRLYPAFPYTNYTLVTRSDSDAMFAYLRSLAPVRQATRAPELRFPYSTQLALRIWRALYFRPGEFVANVAQSDEWNRGAYLVEGLGHCGACHSGRNWLGGIAESKLYAGGPIPMLGWDALPLTLEQPMSDEDARELASLLRTGISTRDVTSGPMAEVVYRSLQHLVDGDIAAIVAYLRTLQPTAPPAAKEIPVSEKERVALMQEGAPIYEKHCADCHGASGEGQPRKHPALAGNRLVTSASSSNAIESTLFGGYGPSTAGNPMPYGMPPYANTLTRREIAAVLTYVRGSWGNQAAAVSPTAVDRH
jgi:mono/diheme cytochrome c family protein